VQHAAWHTVDVIAALEQELAKPEQVYDHESDAMSVLADVNADLIRDAKPEPIYVMGNYAGEGKVVSASFGLPKGAFDTPESHIALEAELAKQTALDKKADNARELGLDYEPEQESICRDDGRCQYSIDHGAEGLGHCPTGKCCMPSTQKLEPEQKGFYVYKPVMPRGVTNVNDANLPWIYDQDPSSGFVARMFVYPAPPRKEWVGLTAEEKEWIYIAPEFDGLSEIQMYGVIETKLKEKNT